MLVLVIYGRMSVRVTLTANRVGGSFLISSTAVSLYVPFNILLQPIVAYTHPFIRGKWVVSIFDVPHERTYSGNIRS
jgi:hypothetical protein